jgi:predicted SprT family Zn-dependent metalloprotease
MSTANRKTFYRTPARSTSEDLAGLGRKRDCQERLPRVDESLPHQTPGATTHPMDAEANCVSFTFPNFKTHVAQAAAGLGCSPNKETGRSGDHTPSPEPVPRDEELNAAISLFQADLPDWKLANLALNELASTVRDWAHTLWAEFVPDEWKGCAVPRPTFFFVFQRESPRILGHYHRGRNGAGFRWEISLNPTNLPRLSEIEIASVVLHEELHAFEDLVHCAPRSPNGYHSAWLRRTADRLGIPCTKFGRTCGIRPNSPFSDWAGRYRLGGTPILTMISDRAESPKPKRKLWRCDCPEGKAVKVYTATGSDFRARCEHCGRLFQPQEGARSLSTAILGTHSDITG